MGNRKSKAAEKSSTVTESQETSTSSKDAVVILPSRMKLSQNVLLIWLNNIIEINSIDYQSTMIELQHVSDNIHTFDDWNQCTDFLTDINNSKACIIISDVSCQNIIPLIHDVTQLHTIFIHCKNKNKYEQWAKDWLKVKGVFTDMASICKAFKKVSYQSDQNDISISFIASDGDVANKNLDQLNNSFMYTQIIKEILLTIKFEKKHIKEFTDYSRAQFIDNEGTLKNINKLECEYHDRTPVWWYSSEYFLYSGLNRALRTMEVDMIIKMGFFIRDLHCQIQQLHEEQANKHHIGSFFTVYRGQGMSKVDFEQLMNTKGGLMSFNNFLSTSKDREVSFLFAESNLDNADSVGILFVMRIDTSKSTTPFAFVIDVSSFQEEDEVLFSMHTTFRICDIKLLGENPRLFQVDLTLTNDSDKDIRVLTDHIREETFPDSSGWYRLGEVLLRLGQPEKAQEVFELLLNQSTDDDTTASMYRAIGRTKHAQKDYKAAMIYYEKSLEIERKTLPPNHPKLAYTYNSIGNVYANMSEHSKALLFLKKALEIRQQSLPPNHPHLATSYNNIGSVYAKIGEYTKALSSYENALAIQQQSLPPNHPHLARSYGNLSLVYDNLGEYSKARSYHEKTLGIQQRSLPPNHPDLAISYNNIGLMYNDMVEYSKALSSHKKVLEIQQQSLRSDHPDLAISYNNTGNGYDNMGEYSKALSFYQKTLAIRQQSVPLNYSHLAISYTNIGNMYAKMGEYSEALSFHKIAVKIRHESLPPDHPDLFHSYNSLGNVYAETGEYSKALSSYENALAIQQQLLPPNYPNLALSYNNIGNVNYIMGGHSKALLFYEKALAILQQSLPSNHPNLALSYNNIGNVHNSMGEYSKALSSYGQALSIQRQSLSPNHPDLGNSYYNIGMVYENVNDYSKARSFYERAVNIARCSLPPNHRDSHRCQKRLDRIKNKL